MGHAIEKLKALAVGKLARKPGMYCDGGGLWLRVSSPTARSWVYRYMLDRASHEMGIGKYPEITLAEARGRAAEARRLKALGKDPLAQRDAIRAAERADAAKAVTFKDAAERYIDAHKAGWKNTKHATQWKTTLETYAYPVIENLSVQSIDTGLVLKVLEPIWNGKTETASRLRGRIEAVLDWAKVRGYRDGENPARWRGHLDKLLPARSKVRKVKHHAALPFDDLPDFMTALRAQDSVAARALEFAILTAARTGEVVGAKWDEIDLAEKLWTVPAARMKAGREHRVPLSARAVEILELMKPDVADGQQMKNADDDFAFAGGAPGKPLSNMAFLMLLRRMGRSSLTAHGFRSTFRDWAAERTSFPSEAAEMALAHKVGDKVEAAYRRGDLFDKRRAMMDQWAIACAMPATGAKIVPMQKAAGA
ncbi:MAG TPA: integrase arm-type DNA-binding domain-containing protein [Xanthobacteraceae bacterium]|nr:integrase arm-type DNA-binding domain-containing protein [Xanthobacteraceae bacterium]